MRIGPSQRLGPNLDTEWGTYPSPYFTTPVRNTRVPEYLPDLIQGRHQFRTQPRNLSLLPADPKASGAYDVLMRDRSSLVPGDVVSHGVGEMPGEAKIGFYIFLGLVGLAAVLAGKGR